MHLFSFRKLFVTLILWIHSFYGCSDHHHGTPKQRLNEDGQAYQEIADLLDMYCRQHTNVSMHEVISQPIIGVGHFGGTVLLIPAYGSFTRGDGGMPPGKFGNFRHSEIVSRAI